MSIDINNLNAPRPDNSRSQGTTGKVASAAAPRAESAPSSAGDASGTSVSISSEAQALTKLEGELKSLPEVDQSRVDAIRARIENGSYEISPEKVAQKMLDMEG